MSEDSAHREHIQRIFLNAVHYVGISKLMAKNESSKPAAVLFTLNEGLFKLGCIKEADYDLLAKRYGRTLKEVMEQKQTRRESSHVPVLSIEQQKEKRLLEQKDKQFKGMLDQWAQHSSADWRAKAFAEAEKYKDKLESARCLLEKKEADA